MSPLSCLILFEYSLFFIEDKAMALHSSTEEPGGLQSMGSLRVGHDRVTSLWLFTFMHWRRKRHPTPVFLPGESRGWQSLAGCRPWGRESQPGLKRLSSSRSDCTGSLLLCVGFGWVEWQLLSVVMLVQAFLSSDFSFQSMGMKGHAGFRRCGVRTQESFPGSSA